MSISPSRLTSVQLIKTWLKAKCCCLLLLDKHSCSVGSTDHSEAAEVKQCVLDMTGSMCWQNELVKHTQQISVQFLSPFHVKRAWEGGNKAGGWHTWSKKHSLHQDAKASNYQPTFMFLGSKCVYVNFFQIYFTQSEPVKSHNIIKLCSSGLRCRSCDIQLPLTWQTSLT